MPNYDPDVTDYIKETKRKAELKEQICAFIISRLKAVNRPIPERELLNKVYLKYNENLSHSVERELKGQVILKNGMYSLKEQTKE